jgi:glycosyltransferase involved in cell wall biosynthesis
MKRLAFVIQRYGEEVNGGAEELCRQVAERLARDFSIDVLTTCARDYLTWKNHYREGTRSLNGVRVRRFPVARNRRVRAFGRFSQKIYGKPHTFTQEAEWMERQGPDTPRLREYIGGHSRDYDLFVFFTYLYPPTFFGLPPVAGKSLLLPCAHDEPPLHLEIFRALFHLPRGLIFNTDEERRLVHSTFGNDYLPWTVCGAGIVIPDPAGVPVRPEDYLLYLGRVDVEKGCGDLFDLFRRYKEKRPSPLKLLLAGEVNMKVPRGRDITPLGFVSPASKAALLANARATVVPSRFESLSLVALESWAAGTPVIAHKGSPVLTRHVEKSGGGWLYGGFRDFSDCLDHSLTDEKVRRRHGQAGRKYVARHYRWEKVLASYRSFFLSMANKVGRDSAHRD